MAKKNPFKKWYKSRVIIFNGLCACLFALEASMGTLKPFVGEQVYAYLSVALIVVNAGLRYFTTTPIKTEKDKSTDATP